MANNYTHEWKVLDDNKCIIVPFDTNSIDTLATSNDITIVGNKISVGECPGCSVVYGSTGFDTPCNYFCHEGNDLHTIIFEQYIWIY